MLGLLVTVTVTDTFCPLRWTVMCKNCFFSPTPSFSVPDSSTFTRIVTIVHSHRVPRGSLCYGLLHPLLLLPLLLLPWLLRHGCCSHGCCFRVCSSCGCCSRGSSSLVVAPAAAAHVVAAPGVASVTFSPAASAPTDAHCSHDFRWCGSSCGYSCGYYSRSCCSSLGCSSCGCHFCRSVTATSVASAP